jgi:hypothetical protein
VQSRQEGTSVSTGHLQNITKYRISTCPRALIKSTLLRNTKINSGGKK